MQKILLYIRVDGNAEIGTGHVMRCLALAQSERRQGGDCVFITADTQMKSLINESGFDVICLNSEWNDLDSETEKMEQLIARLGIKKLLVDSYFVTQDYLARLHKLTYLVYIDDLNEFIYPCSELINYNIYAEKLDYPSRYPDTVLKLGPKYAPLREEFADLPPRIVNKSAQTVLVTAGGSDSLNVTGQFLERVMRHPVLLKLQYSAVAGKLNKHLPELLSLAEKYTNVTIHQDVGNMAELMRSSDIAVSAGGSTLYELCACGTPTVVFAWADNQLMAVETFGDGYMLGCGDFREDSEGCLERMAANVARLAGDFELRREMAERCWKLRMRHLHGRRCIPDSRQ